MLVVCNNRDKDWCPYGSKDCECDVYYPIELDGQDRDFFCTDKYLVDRDCYLEEVAEEISTGNNKQINIIKNYLENAYSGAKMMNDVEVMTKVARAIAALQADVEKDIFTEEFMEEWILKFCSKEV